jgi:hypothetical protein
MYMKRVNTIIQNYYFKISKDKTKFMVFEEHFPIILRKSTLINLTKPNANYQGPDFDDLKILKKLSIK